MTLRRVKKRSALPVLAAFLVGSTAAGAATLLVGPDEVPLVGDGAVLAATFSTIERAPGTARHVPPRHTSSSTAAAPAAPKTSTPQPTSTRPATTTPKPSAPPTSTVSAPPSQPDPAPSNQTDRVIALVNEARAANGCAALRVEEHLTAAAAAHSSDMSDRNYLSHTTPEGVTFDERIKNAGYPQPGGENIASGQRSAAQVMDAWMNSTGHKANILNCEFKVIGVGLDTDGFFWTQNFGY